MLKEKDIVTAAFGYGGIHRVLPERSECKSSQAQRKQRKVRKAVCLSMCQSVSLSVSSLGKVARTTAEQLQ